MKYIFFVALMAMSRPNALLAHDGSNHVEVAWYQELSFVTILIGLTVLGILLAGIGFYMPQYRKIFAGVGVVSILLAFVGFQLNQTAATPVDESVVASLTGLPVTIYRTEGCSCCTGFAKELEATGANVTVETITQEQMREVKDKYHIAPDQESCHTSVIDGYIVEGHVPFAAILQLVEDRPSISGITLPGMPVGTPGMPGKQTEIYTVTTLDNEPFWQSS
jgi:hypothetical protein